MGGQVGSAEHVVIRDTCTPNRGYPDMNIALEFHGYSISNDYTYESTAEVVASVLDKLDAQLPVGLAGVDTLVTGVHEHIANEIEEALEARNEEITFERRYPRITNWMDGTEDDLDDWYEAKVAAFDKRDAMLCKEGYNHPDIDRMVLATDSTGSGAWQARHAISHGVLVSYVSTQEFIDWDAALERDDSESESDSEGEADSSDINVAADSLLGITHIGPTKKGKLEEAGYETPEDVATAEPSELAQTEMVGEATAAEMIADASGEAVA